tara:strand:- start:538 stop:753 length:216 start_codon:yes stop_codon:yes gene_type:complete
MNGIPVVTTDCTSSDEIVLDNKTGFVVPRGDLKLFFEKLEQMIENYTLRQQFSKAAYIRSREEFSIDKMCS